MAADAQEITKVDSAISGLSSSPKDEKHVPAKKRTSSSAPGVMNINDLGMLALVSSACRSLPGSSTWHLVLLHAVVVAEVDDNVRVDTS